MPETEQFELRTDSVEQIIDTLETGANGGTFADTGLTRERATAIVDRLRKQISKPDAVAFCGLPGAGKSYTAEKAAEVYDAPVVSMGDAIRENAPDGATSEELGNFAANTRAADAEQIPKWVVEIADKYHRGVGEYAARENDLIIIDGVRSTTDYEVLKDYFDDFYLIEVEAEFYKRLSRLQDRGREGEAQFDAVDLAERDKRERNELGFGDLIEYSCPDMNIKNGTGADQLAISLSSVVENNLPFEIQNGKPLGLDGELEEFRSKKM